MKILLVASLLSFSLNSFSATVSGLGIMKCSEYVDETTDGNEWFSTPSIIEIAAKGWVGGYLTALSVSGLLKSFKVNEEMKRIRKECEKNPGLEVNDVMTRLYRNSK